MSAPLIVTAELGEDDFAWLNSLRGSHFPPDRNQLPAHLTLFHQLPPSAESELRSLLAALAGEPPPRATVSGILDLGSGTAIRIASPDLEDIRAIIADRFHGMLTAQDGQGWIPHVTIQNKVPRKDAVALAKALEGKFDGRPVRIAGLGAHHYRGGPWETIRSWAFRG